MTVAKNVPTKIEGLAGTHGHTYIVESDAVFTVRSGGTGPDPATNLEAQEDEGEGRWLPQRQCCPGDRGPPHRQNDGGVQGAPVATKETINLAVITKPNPPLPKHQMKS